MKGIGVVVASLFLCTPLLAERKLIDYVQTKYPRTAMYAGVSGKVVLNVAIHADGSIKSVEALYGPTILSYFCKRDVMRWRFEPGIEESFRVFFLFQLINSGKEENTFNDHRLTTTIVRIRPRIPHPHLQ